MLCSDWPNPKGRRIEQDFEQISHLLLERVYPGKGNKADLDFQVSDLETMKTISEKAATADDFVAGMKKSYPPIAGEENLEKIAGKIYK